MKIQKRVAAVGGLAIIAGVLGVLRSELHPTPQRMARAPSQSTPKKGLRVNKPIKGTPSEAPSARPRGAFDQRASSDGCVQEIRNPLANEGQVASEGLKPEQLEVRAKEWIRSLKQELCLHNGEESRLQLSSSSGSRFVFRQSWNGIPFWPTGSVSVDLTPDGELLRVTSRKKDVSSYHLDRAVAPGAAEHLAEAFIGKSDLYPGVDSNARLVSEVIWIEPTQVGTDGSKITEGRLAYDVLVQGTRVVVDAGTGRILSSRDAKVF